MNLPGKIVESTLMNSHPDDILAYCATSQTAQELCNSKSFWNQKSLRDFGFPLDLVDQQSYFWQYKLIQSMNERGLILGILIRAGLNDLVVKYLETHSVEEAIEIAIEQDDITTLQYLRNYIYGQYDPDEYYGDNPYFGWIKLAFISGSRRAIEFLMNPPLGEYEFDIILLTELFEAVSQNPRSLQLLDPYILKLVRDVPAVFADPELLQHARELLS